MAQSYTNKKGQTYFLHGRQVILRGGRQQQIYFFAREHKSGLMDNIPEGYEVVENEKTGLPLLKKSLVTTT